MKEHDITGCSDASEHPVMSCSSSLESPVTCDELQNKEGKHG